jgi:hypothetical protein
MKAFVLALFLCLSLGAPLFGSSSAVIYPAGTIFFPYTAVGSTSTPPQTASVFNVGTTSITVNSVVITPSQFALVGGTTPVTIAPGAYASFSLSFTPAKAKGYNGTMTFNFSSGAPQTLALNGSGTSTTSVAGFSGTKFSFGTVPVGTTSAPQTLTINNTGSTPFKVKSVTVTQPFAQTGFVSQVTVNPGQSLPLQLTYLPVNQIVNNGEILVTYDILAPAGISLSGTGGPPTGLGINTFPTLPTGIQNAAYQATLSAVGGVGPLNWSLAYGTTLPSGLSLSSAGVITGTLGGVPLGNYNFNVQATDSETPPVTVVADFALPVAAPTGSSCNNIYWDVAGTTNPLVSISDLGTGYYLGQYQGGLYASGSNIDDPNHDSYGAGLAAGIQPLDSNGNPSPTGKYVLISIGHSNTQSSFTDFATLANAYPGKNPNLLVVDGATGGASADLIQDPTSYFWTIMSADYLPNAGVTANQVVAAYVNDVKASHPISIGGLQPELESIAQNLLTKFPNIKIAYFSSLNYTGYSNGVKNYEAEPNAYEAGFAVKGAVQDQINGAANLNFNPALGPVVAPWMAWGPYYWTNGLLGRSDGLTWSCADSNSDGTHPSEPGGRVKIATQLLNFFTNDDTAAPWFVAPASHK